MDKVITKVLKVSDKTKEMMVDYFDEFKNITIYYFEIKYIKAD